MASKCSELGQPVAACSGSKPLQELPDSPSRLSSPEQNEIPDKPNACGHTKAQQAELGARVLVEAFRKLCEGWCSPFSLEDIGNGEAPGGWGLIGAVQASSLERPGEPWVDCWYARRLLQGVEFNLQAFERRPGRKHADILELVRRAIEGAGFIPPPMPGLKRLLPRRGGWAAGDAREKTKAPGLRKRGAENAKHSRGRRGVSSVCPACGGLLKTPRPR